MSSYKEAIERIPTQTEKIINLLKEAGKDGVTNFALAKICLKYDARISELRRKGYEIETVYEGKTVYKYVLKKVPSNDRFFMNATDEILMIVDQKFDGYITSKQLKKLLDYKHFHIIRKSGWYQKLLH